MQEFQFVVFNDMIVIWIVPSCLRHSFEPLCKCLPVVVRQLVLVWSSTGTDVTSRIVRMPHSHVARETRPLAMCKVAQMVRFSSPGCAVVATRDVSGTALSDTRAAAVSRRVRSASHQSGKRRLGVREVYHSVHDSLERTRRWRPKHSLMRNWRHKRLNGVWPRFKLRRRKGAQPKNKVQTVKKTQDQQREQQANEQSQQPNNLPKRAEVGTSTRECDNSFKSRCTC